MEPEWDFVGLETMGKFQTLISNSHSACRDRPESGFWRRSHERFRNYIEINGVFSSQGRKNTVFRQYLANFSEYSKKDMFGQPWTSRRFGSQSRPQCPLRPFPAFSLFSWSSNLRDYSFFDWIFA
ncbi:hypothetical protein TNCT_79641 [Trichonephila clavata]|uniref:Uncharacterized protein n=1 Tax=Trichonephila clavata TaxID=2740835 RepID=A0A8X6HX29_TRICU|nr:hypothetical protein TNCT_79641 [Trichonephila clavata]